MLRIGDVARLIYDTVASNVKHSRATLKIHQIGTGRILYLRNADDALWLENGSSGGTSKILSFVSKKDDQDLLDCIYKYFSADSEFTLDTEVQQYNETQKIIEQQEEVRRKQMEMRG